MEDMVSPGILDPVKFYYTQFWAPSFKILAKALRFNTHLSVLKISILEAAFCFFLFTSVLT